MVSDSDLVTRLREILSKSDLDTATAGGIRRQLEEDFGVDLSDKKKFIREQIDIFLEALENVKQTEERVEKDQNQNDGVKEEEEESNSQNDGVQEKEEEEESERSSKAEKVRKRGGFTKLCSLSPQLQEVVGSPELARTEVVKKLWAYIRENNLQDPKNKKKIKCDEALRAVFRVNSIDMFQMNKALSRHIWPLAAEDERPKQNECEDNSESVVDNEEDVEEEQEEDEEEAVERESNGRTKKRGSTEVDKVVKKKAGGFTKLCTLSPQLQQFIGVPELARTGVVKKIWAHIRNNNLQDPKNKRNIICDESLRALFHVDSIDMFQMNKALSKHILGAANEEDAPSYSLQKEKGSKQVREEAPSSSYKKEKGDKRGREEDPDESKQYEKPQKKSSSGLLVPLRLSDALIKFFGTGENALSRSAVVKRMWEYVKENDLQDPSDKRRIICDDKLKELFKVDSFTGFTVSKLLAAHFIKAEQEQ